MDFESVVEQQIRLARERGEFDNLPGMGKPLPGWGRPDDELWWIREYMRREGLSGEAMLPTPLRLARELERLPEEVGRLTSERAVRRVVDELNKRISEYLRAPSGPHARIQPADPDEVVRQWRAARAPVTPAAEPPPPAGRRRWFRRRP